MAGRTSKKAPANPEAAVVLDAIEQTLRDGTIPLEKDYPLDTGTRKRLDAIAFDLLSTRELALAIARGDLSSDFAVKGCLAGSLKELQANLRHLTWQAGQIAGGDFSQRVHFMGEFATSFNTMTAHLAANKVEHALQEKKLVAANTELAKEVAEYQRLEQALSFTNRKLSLLSSVTRHDVKNQLSALGAYIDLIRSGHREPEVLERYLDGVDQAIKTIAGQIQFESDYEDLGVKEPAWNNLSAIIAEASGGLAFGNVRLEVAAAGAEIYADPLISKVFFNLLDNALRYGGPAMTEIRITAEEGPDGLGILVQDNGAGIAEADRSKLFTRGFGKNTGFGLFLSREILSLTGIAIREENSPGGGARFRILVPRGEYRFRQK